MKLIIFLTFLAFNWCFGANATPTRGPSDGGGGFAYQATSARWLRLGQQGIIRALSAVTDSEFQAVIAKFPGHTMDRRALIEVIRNVHKDYLGSANRRDSEGKLEPLDLNYNLNGNYIVALEPFFQEFNRSDLSSQDASDIVVKLLHEASHLFGFGLKDDSESANLSNDLGSVVTSHWYDCGGNDSIENNIESCGTSFRQNSETWDLVARRIVEPYTYGAIAYQVWQNRKTGQIIATKRDEYAYHYDTLCSSEMGGIAHWRLPRTDELPGMFQNGLADLITFEADAQIYTDHNFLLTRMILGGAYTGDCVWTSQRETTACQDGSMENHDSWLTGTTFDPGRYPVVCVSTGGVK